MKQQGLTQIYLKLCPRINRPSVEAIESNINLLHNLSDGSAMVKAIQSCLSVSSSYKIHIPEASHPVVYFSSVYIPLLHYMAIANRTVQQPFSPQAKICLKIGNCIIGLLFQEEVTSFASCLRNLAFNMKILVAQRVLKK